MSIINFDNGKEKKVIGTLNRDKRTFTKTVSESKHLYRKNDAWGIDADLFTTSLLPENYLIILIDKENGIKYSVAARDFNDSPWAVFFHFKTHDRDFGAQIFLPRIHWMKEKYIPAARKRKTSKKPIPGVLNKL